MNDDHLSLDELAELDEGLITSARAEAMREHARGCAECNAKLEALAETRSMLADLPPVTMPADVRARLDQALEGEANPTTSDRPSVEAVPDLDPEPRVLSGPPIDSTARSADIMPAPGTVVRPRFGRPTAASSAVAAALVLVIGAVIVGHYHHNAGNSDSATSASSGSIASGSTNGLNLAPNSAKASMTVTSTDKTYTVTNLAKRIQNSGITAVAPGVSAPAPTNGPPASSSPGTVANGGGVQPSGGPPTIGAGGHQTTPTPAPSPDSAQFGNEAALNKPVPKPLRPLYSSRKKILACAASLTGDDTVPLRVDFGYYSDATHHKLPSAVFVFANKSASSVTVWVTNASCSGNKVVRTYNAQVGITN